MHSHSQPIDLLAVYRTVKDSDNTSYLLSNGLQIARVNTGWTKFALENGGKDLLARWGRGSSILDAIPGALRGLYQDGFLRALATGKQWEHDYECSSPGVYREFRMYAFPVESTFLAVTHALRIERPHDRAVSPADDAAYTSDGIIRMCSYCRRVHAVEGRDRWDWVPAYVSAMPANVSHGLCPPCATFHRLDWH
jgi:hypothetical protein